MGFNFGAFAGGMAKGATDTYTMLKEQQAREEASQRAERALKIQEEDSVRRRSEFERLERERKGLSDAISEMPTTNTVPVADFGAAKGGVDEGLPMRTETLTPEQRRANFRQRAISLGANPEAVQRYEAGDLSMDVSRQQIRLGDQTLKKGEFEIDKLGRDAEIDKRFQTFLGGLHAKTAERMNDIELTGQQTGMKGLVDKFGPELKKAFPGMDVQLVGNNIVVKQGKKVVQTISSLDKAVSALQGVAQAEFSTNFQNGLITQVGFKNAADAIQYFKDREDSARKDRDTDSLVGLRGAQGVQALAAARHHDASAGALGVRTGNWQPIGTDSDGAIVSYDRNTGNVARSDGKPIQDQTIFRKVTGERGPASEEPKPADINAFLRDQGNMIVDVDPNTKKPRRLMDLSPQEQATVARSVLSRVAPAAQQTGGLPDANPQAMARPGATAPAASQPAQPAQSAIPQGPNNMAQRLSTAFTTDNQRGSRLEFGALAHQVEQEMPGVRNAIAQLQRAIPLAKSPAEAANLRARLDQYTNEMTLMQSVLDQRSAQNAGN